MTAQREAHLSSITAEAQDRTPLLGVSMTMARSVVLLGRSEKHHLRLAGLECFDGLPALLPEHLDSRP